MDELALLAVAAGVVWLVGVGWGLWDLSRHEVEALPRWAWGVAIVVVTFPLGLIVYLAVGRGAPLDEREPPGPAPVSPPPEPSVGRRVDRGDLVVRTVGLTKRYDGVAAVDDVDLAVPRNSVYGLIGPNGAGKTTLLSLLARLRRPSSGRVEVAAEPTEMAVLPDSPDFDGWLTGREVVDLARHLVGPQLASGRVDEALAEVGLAAAADRRVGGYSRGMLQRLGLATCLVGDPDLLVFDEPSSALDPAGRRAILDLVARLSRDKTVILSTHVLGDVQQVCDTVGLPQEGRLVFQGPLADLLSRAGAAFLVRTRRPTDDLVAALRSQPWSREVTEVGPATVRLVATDAAAVERDLARVVAESGAPLVSFAPATDLETAFLELTS